MQEDNYYQLLFHFVREYKIPLIRLFLNPNSYLNPNTSWEPIWGKVQRISHSYISHKFILLTIVDLVNK